MARSVEASGTRVLMADERGEPMLVELSFGSGSVLMAGWDTGADSLDGSVHCETTHEIAGHTLARLLTHLALPPPTLRTGQTFLYKELVRRGERDFLLFYSHQRDPFNLTACFGPRGCPRTALDLATGRTHPVRETREAGWFEITLRIEPRTGAYLALEA